MVANVQSCHHQVLLCDFITDCFPNHGSLLLVLSFKPNDVLNCLHRLVSVGSVVLGIDAYLSWLPFPLWQQVNISISSLILTYLPWSNTNSRSRWLCHSMRSLTSSSHGRSMHFIVVTLWFRMFESSSLSHAPFHRWHMPSCWILHCLY